VAKRQREQHATAPHKTEADTQSLDLQQRQQREVEAFDPLIQRLLAEYGEHVFGKSLLQKRFLVRLERPGGRPGARGKTWNWHWHLYSLARGMQGVEMHPLFAADGMIEGFLLACGAKRIEAIPASEETIKEGLVSLFLQHSQDAP
jgi:hypothetical protein